MLTLIGVIVVPLGAYWLIKLDTNKLLYMFAATAAFSSATIVEFKGSTFGMPPSFFIGILLILASTIRCIISKSIIRVGKIQKYFFLSFSIMWLYYLLSLLFPAIFLLSGIEYSLLNPAFDDRNYAGDIPVYTVTQFLYFTFFLVTSFVIMYETRDLYVVKKTVKILLMAALFTVMWGISFYVLNFAGVIEYPDWVFNNHPGYAQGFAQRVGILPRMSSVAQEPSVYGYYLSIMISMVMMLNILGLYVMKPSLQKISCIIMIVTAILTTSTTALLGILVSFLITLMLSIYYGKFKKSLAYQTKQLVIILVIALGLPLAISTKNDFDINGVIDTFNQVTFMKAKSGSGEERSESLFHGIGVLLDTYYLGTGFASNRNFDMGSTILSNTGLIGFVFFVFSFSGVLVAPLLKSVVYMRQNEKIDDKNKITIGLIASLITALVIMFTSIPDFVNMYFWLIVGLLMGMSNHFKTTFKQPVI